jgi:hypothetical protein
MNKKKISFKTILIFVIVILTGVLAVMGLNVTRTYLSGADTSIKPQNVLAIPGKDGRSVTITWTTEKPSISMVSWGTTPANTMIKAGQTDLVTSHNIKVDTLRPGTTYYFKIVIGSDEYMENGVPYSFKTPSGTADQTSASEEETEAVPTVVVPTAAVATPEATPTTAEIDTSKCDRVTDYNSDGVVNSLDYYYCIQSLSNSTSTPSATPTTASTGCDASKDNNGDGVINSLDALWCLQNTN